MIGPFDYLMLRSKRAGELEETIDKALRHAAAWETGAITLFSSGWPRDIIETVLSRYREAGWKAQLFEERSLIQLEVPS